METALFEVGFDKNGEIDFGVNGSIVELNREDYAKFQSMIITAIGVMEDMRTRHFYSLPENQASQVSS